MANDKTSTLTGLTLAEDANMARNLISENAPQNMAVALAPSLRPASTELFTAKVVR